MVRGGHSLSLAVIVLAIGRRQAAVDRPGCRLVPLGFYGTDLAKKAKGRQRVDAVSGLMLQACLVGLASLAVVQFLQLDVMTHGRHHLAL